MRPARVLSEIDNTLRSVLDVRTSPPEPSSFFQERVMAAVRQCAATQRSDAFLFQVFRPIFAVSCAAAVLLLCQITVGKGAAGYDPSTWFTTVVSGLPTGFYWF